MPLGPIWKRTLNCSEKEAPLAGGDARQLEKIQDKRLKTERKHIWPKNYDFKSLNWRYCLKNVGRYKS